jgi:hypothetical protein
MNQKETPRPEEALKPEVGQEKLLLSDLLAKAEEMKADPTGFEDYICDRTNLIPTSEASINWAKVQGKTSPNQNTRYLADRVLGLPIPINIDAPSSLVRATATENEELVLQEDLKPQE